MNSRTLQKYICHFVARFPQNERISMKYFLLKMEQEVEIVISFAVQSECFYTLSEISQYDYCAPLNLESIFLSTRLINDTFVNIILPEINSITTN